MVVYDGDKNKCSSQTDRQHSTHNRQKMIAAIMQKYSIEHISDEMDSIKLSKRGTEDEREYCVGRSEMARPPFYEIITATG